MWGRSKRRESKWGFVLSFLSGSVEKGREKKRVRRVFVLFSCKREEKNQKGRGCRKHHCSGVHIFISSPRLLTHFVTIHFGHLLLNGIVWLMIIVFFFILKILFCMGQMSYYFCIKTCMYCLFIFMKHVLVQ